MHLFVMIDNRWRMIKVQDCQLFICLGNQFNKMDLGATVAVFLLLAFLLFFLFCLLLKCFARRLKKQRRQVQMDSNNEECLSNHLIEEGAYAEFREKRQMRREVEMKEISVEGQNLIQPTQIRQIMDISNNIYGVSRLRQNLLSQTIPLQLDSQRSIPSLKSFHISRLNTMQTQKERSFHTYVLKLVEYGLRGLTIVQIQVECIKKVGDESYEMVQKVQQNVVDYTSSQFLDQLEINGFNFGQYGFYKYVNAVDVSDLKLNEKVALKNLKVNQSKEAVNQQQYASLRRQLLGQL